MSDIKDILNSVLSDEKLLRSKAFRDKVYSDTPLLRPASQLKSSETPQKIKDMKALAYTPEAYWKTSAWLFVQQGQFMADYSDVSPVPGHFELHYPTYRDMNTEQLRGYFSWRRQLRNGTIVPAPAPYLMMYAFELINLIGVDGSVSAFRQLGLLRQSFSENEEFCRKLALWQKDIAVRYELPEEFISALPEADHDRLLLSMINWDKISDDQLFDAAEKLSAYRTDQSRFFAEKPDLFRKGFCCAYRALAGFYRDKRKNSLFEKLFGKMAETGYHLFEGAVYYEKEPTRDSIFILSDIQIYTCKFGRWSVLRFHNRGRNKVLGEIFRETDFLLRDMTGYRYKVNHGEVSKTNSTVMKKALEEAVKKSRQKAAVKIEFDLSKLDAIRAASEATCEKLIVEEEELPEFNASAMPETEQKPASDPPLSAAETGFMKALLSRGDWSEAAKKSGSMPSLLADSINDELFDNFGDTVIAFDGDVPYIIEDYAEELASMLGLTAERIDYADPKEDRFGDH